MVREQLVHFKTGMTDSGFFKKNYTLKKSLKNQNETFFGLKTLTTISWVEQFKDRTGNNKLVYIVALADELCISWRQLE